MNGHPQFRLSRWIAGSLFGLVAANLSLILFVAGVDIFLGQPPQLMMPLFALLVATGSLVFSRRNGRVESYSEARADDTSMAASAGSQRRAPNVPAYVAMTIIRRPLVFAQTSEGDKWKGVKQ